MAEQGRRENGLVVAVVYVCTWIGENVWVELTVTLSEGLHHSVNLLGFSRQPETPQELPIGTHVEKVDYIQKVHVNLRKQNGLETNNNPPKKREKSRE